MAKSKTIYNFREAPQEDIETERIGAVLSNDDGSIDIIHSEGGVRTTKEGGFSNEFATLFEETFHASEFDKGKLDLKEYTCRDEAKAWKFATKAPGTALRFSLKDESGQYRELKLLGCHIITRCNVGVFFVGVHPNAHWVFPAFLKVAVVKHEFNASTVNTLLNLGLFFHLFHFFIVFEC